MYIKRLIILLTMAVITSGGALAAHHAVGAIYRLDEPLTIKGTLVSIVYRSPHSYLHVQAPDHTNHMRVWAVECGTSQQLRRNVEDGGLKPGDDIVVTGDPGRDEGEWRLRLRTVTRPADGWHWKDSIR